MKAETTKELRFRLGQLFGESLRMSHSLYQLHLIREKIEGRGYEYFDKGDILGEFSRLQGLLTALDLEMRTIHDILKHQG
ncbi:hypothetical protein MYP_2997 [Sporocytophaga myxococcoides]|uniref:Uncharacterized protein n=1 Tax=Sporocytophaga myxococcoides TaxID=153721 RepID=A0A098LIB8_9BACT|nr:hypothetical protein [Sporocytophaga myxococcoides]GAL85768.1 hypothetical protein MYP_2997 [Sporocytophaga myxococcoides]